jgi:hypothetical protein
MGFQNWRWHGFQLHGFRVEFHNRAFGGKAVTSGQTAAAAGWQLLLFPIRTQNKESRLQTRQDMG